MTSIAKFNQFLSSPKLSAALGMREVQLKLYSFPPTQAENKPLFLYHVPKTAGLTFRNAIMFGMLARRKASAGKEFNKEVEAVFKWDEDYSKEILSKGYDFVSAWKPFGFHSEFAQDFNLVTVVREPFERIVSRFRYNCHMAGTEFNEAEFEAFFRNEKQINHQTKMLSGVGDTKNVTDAELQMAKDNLSTFYAYTTIDKINELIVELISQYNLPNVIGEKSNVSLAKHTMDWEQYRAEINKLNQMDQQLFDHVRENPKHPDVMINTDQTVSELTNVIFERGEDNNFKCGFASTEVLVGTLDPVP